jgi:hypothetical protein
MIWLKAALSSVKSKQHNESRLYKKGLKGFQMHLESLEQKERILYVSRQHYKI